MSDKEVTITFKTDGGTSIDAENFAGPECESATKAFEDALGTVTKRTRKKEYSKTARRSTQQQQRLGRE